MQSPFIETLQELKTAKAKISKTETRKINLFESNHGIEIKFNRFRNPSDYLIYIQRMYFDCKSHFDEIISKSSDLNDCYRILETARFEVKELKNFYFYNDELLLFRRLEYELSNDFPIEFESLLKKPLLEFFNIQSLLINNLYDYFNDRIRLVRKEIIHINFQESSNYKKSLVNKKGQLSLFPTGSNTPLLKWVKSKAEFMTLVSALHEIKAFNRTDSNLTFNDLIEYLSWSMGIDVGDPHGTLKAVKNRKTTTPFFDELESAFKRVKYLP